MKSLSKDITRKIALELSTYDLIKFCLTDKKSYRDICDSKDFWRQKLMIDYPIFVAYYQKNNLILKNPKNTYIRKFTEKAKEIENLLDKLGISDPAIRKEMEKDILSIYNDHPRWNKYTKNLKEQEKSFNIYWNYILDFIMKYKLDLKRKLDDMFVNFLKKDYIQINFLNS
jgi:hypothetical protein